MTVVSQILWGPFWCSPRCSLQIFADAVANRRRERQVGMCERSRAACSCAKTSRQLSETSAVELGGRRADAGHAEELAAGFEGLLVRRERWGDVLLLRRLCSNNR